MNALQQTQQANYVASVDLTAQVSDLVNQLFNRLCTYCNRWRYNYPTDEALEEAKFIWIEELVNHDVLSVDMLERGLAIVRAARSDYFPNLFDFIEWCKIPMDLPSEEELAQRLASFQCYGMADVDKFKFNSTVEYWLITDLYCRCRRYTWSVEQLRKEIKQALRNMGDRLKNGEVLPEPTKQLLPQATSMPVSKTRQAEIIASIKGSLRGH